MRVRRDGSWYSVCELMLSVELQLATTKDYRHGDNSDVVATDSIKNTVHAMAKKNEVCLYKHSQSVQINRRVLYFTMQT